MNDREPLELAAKAANNGAQWDCEERGMMILSSNGCDTDSWNPLKDDGDAFRLAIKLKITYQIHIVHPFVAAFAPDVIGRFEESTEPDEFAATRRAIVRAAAEIGAKL